MIIYLATARACDTVGAFLPNYLKPLRGRISVMDYNRLAHLAELPAATYVFTDFERMNPDQMALAQQVFDAIRTQRPELQLLNEPRSFVPRFEFLRLLEKEGLNRHRVFRIHEIDESVRYPVFVRMDNDHFGPRSDLIRNRHDLEDVMLAAAIGGAPIEHLMVVEFVDVRAPDGQYRLCGASKFGGTATPRHRVSSTDWIVKAPDVRRGDEWTEDMVAEELNFMRGDLPHEVDRAFKLAGLDYGRIDYFAANDKLNVWEINSNPNLIVNPGKVLPERGETQKLMVERVIDGFNNLDYSGPINPGIHLGLSIPGSARIPVVR